MADDRELDAMLNDALASYAAEEPDPAAGARILTRVAEAPQRPRRWWVFVPAAASAAAVMLAVMLQSPSHAPISPPSIANTAEPPVAVTREPSQIARSRAALTRNRPRPSKQPAFLRVRSFPLASPRLTAEEIVLLKFVAEHPDQARSALIAPTAQPIEATPLAIPSIQIAALSDAEHTEPRR